MRGGSDYAKRFGAFFLTLKVKKNSKFVSVEVLTAVLLKRLVFL